MIDKECAIEVKTHSLNACEELTAILRICEQNSSAEEFEKIKRGVGLSLGSIQIDVLDLVYEAFPEISDVK